MKNIVNVLEYIKVYKFNSIFVKEFITIMLVILIPLACVNIMIYHYFNDKSNSRLIYDNNIVLFKLKDSLDTMAQDIDKISYSIISDDYVQLFMLSENNTLSNKEIYNRTNNIKHTIGAFALANDLLDSIYVYSDKNNYIISNLTSNTALGFRDNSWLSQYRNLADSVTSWIETRPINTDGNLNYYLSFFKTVSPYTQKDGIVVVNINIKKIEKQINKLVALNMNDFFILDEKGNILYSKDHSKLNTNIKNINYINAEYHQDSKKVEYKYAGSDRKSIISTTSDYNNWQYVYVFELNDNSQSVKILVVVSLSLNLFIAVFIAYFVSLRIFKPITRIISIIHNFENDVAEDNIEDDSKHDEFRYIAKNIINTFSSYKHIEKELDQKLKLLKKLQTIALQSQINPHFLFNTLEIINLKAAIMLKGENDISFMISSLSKLLRLSLETQDHLVLIQEEILHVRTYLDILKVRYEDKFDVVWSVDSDILSYKICKITLQPLIENAIYHGIKPLDDKGTIWIKGYVKNDNILIEVKDNGIGISQEKLQSINNDLSSEYIKENKNIGVFNVDQRIKLIFGQQYGLSINANEYGGTSIAIMIPKVK